MALRDLLVSWGVEVTGEEKLDSVDKKVDDIGDKLQNIAKWASIAFAFKGITSFITDTIELGRSLSFTSQKLGVGVDELERFRYAASMAGVDSADADRALQFMQRNLGKLEEGSKGAAKEFGFLGATVHDSHGKLLPFNQILENVASRFEAITDPAKRVEMAMALNGRQGAALIPMWIKGAAGLHAYNLEFDALGGGIGADFAKSSEEAGNGIKRLTFVWTVMKTRLVAQVMPAVMKITDMFVKLVNGIEWLAKHTYVAQTALIALGVAGVALAAPLLLAWAPLLLAFGALYLLFDDIFTLFSGGTSLIGRFIDSLFGVGTAKELVKELKQDFSSFIDWVKATAIPVAKDLSEWLPKAFKASLPYVRAMFYAVEDTFKILTNSWMVMAHLLAAAGKASTGDFEGASQEASLASKSVDAAGRAFTDDHKEHDPAKEAEDWMRSIGAHKAHSTEGFGPYRDFDNRSKDTFDSTEGAGYTTPGAGKAPMQQTNHISVTVQGGNTNAETASTVAGAVQDVFQQQVMDAYNGLPVVP